MKKLRVIATIEARMNSSRLHGKVLKNLGGYPLLDVLIRRLKKSKTLDDIVVATTVNKKDDKIISLLNMYLCKNQPLKIDLFSRILRKIM